MNNLPISFLTASKNYLGIASQDIRNAQPFNKLDLTIIAMPKQKSVRDPNWNHFKNKYVFTVKCKKKVVSCRRSQVLKQTVLLCFYCKVRLWANKACNLHEHCSEGENIAVVAYQKKTNMLFFKECSTFKTLWWRSALCSSVPKLSQIWAPDATEHTVHFCRRAHQWLV